MSKLLSFLLATILILFTFDITLVAARPKTLKYRSVLPTPGINLSHLNTNAKRFAAGHPPLPPIFKKLKPTKVATAKRQVTSQCAKSGVIQVLDDNSIVIGYVSMTLQDNQQYTLATIANAGTFSSSVFTSGQTQDINILDVTDGTHFLAGLIMTNQALGDGSSDSEAAILGRSLATNPGSTPQANRDPSFNNRDAETAIWTYDRADTTLTATWVNYAGQTPAITPVFLYYLTAGTKFYLTSSSATPQNGTPVTFRFISVNDQCGS